MSMESYGTNVAPHCNEDNQPYLKEQSKNHHKDHNELQDVALQASQFNNVL